MLRGSDPKISDVFFPLSDETRLSVINKLGARTLSAASLSRGVPVTRQAILKYLQVLEYAGLVSHEKCGREVPYRLDRRRPRRAQAFLSKISAGWDRALTRLHSMVEKDSAGVPQPARRR